MPLPKGYTLDKPPQVKLPAGYTLDGPSSEQPDPPKIKPFIAGSMTAANPSWLDKAEADVRLGGGRTIIGRALGRLQGSDKGYSGLGGVSEGVQNFMGSPVLGILHAGKGVQEIPDHPVRGAVDTALGLSEAATIPSMVMGGPASKAAVEAVPSKAYAGKLFSELATDAGKANVKVPLRRSIDPLRRLLELGDAGHTLPKAVGQLGDQTGPIPYQKARDFASAISNLSSLDKQAILPQTKAALGKLASDLHGDISQSLAPIAGGAEKYADALKNYSRASRLADAGKIALKYALPSAGIGAAAYEGYQKLRRLL